MVTNRQKVMNMVKTSNKHKLVFKGKSDLLDKYRKLVSKCYIMDSILQKIKNLKRGKVDPKDTKRRSKVGSYFSSEAQQMLSYINSDRIAVKEEIITGLKETISKGEAILRENIVLQSRPPLDVIKFKNVPVRYAYNLFGRNEQRLGYGMHKLPTTEQGYSISMAFMPPEYLQVFHNHTVPEYTLVLDKKTFGFSGAVSKKNRIVADTNEILYFSAKTIHALYNPNSSITRNITVKSPTGVLDWKPFYNLHTTESDHGKVIKGESLQLNIGGTKLTFSINDKPYNYDLEILELNENFIMEDIYKEDRFLFVIEGNLLVSSKGIKKHCSKNDYIVIDKNTPFKIKTKTECKLYVPIIKSKTFK